MSLDQLLSENIKEIRERLGITKAELARRMGVSASYVDHIESGHRRPSLMNLYALWKALGIMPEAFFMLFTPNSMSVAYRFKEPDMSEEKE